MLSSLFARVDGLPELLVTADTSCGAMIPAADGLFVYIIRSFGSLLLNNSSGEQYNTHFSCDPL